MIAVVRDPLDHCVGRLQNCKYFLKEGTLGSLEREKDHSNQKKFQEPKQNEVKKHETLHLIQTKMLSRPLLMTAD